MQPDHGSMSARLIPPWPRLPITISPASMCSAKATISGAERVAPPIAKTLHHPNGTHHPITASAARINISAALPASQTPEIG
jgi:hypothetical protein